MKMLFSYSKRETDSLNSIETFLEIILKLGKLTPYFNILFLKLRGGLVRGAKIWSILLCDAPFPRSRQVKFQGFTLQGGKLIQSSSFGIPHSSFLIWHSSILIPQSSSFGFICCNYIILLRKKLPSSIQKNSLISSKLFLYY